MRKRVLFFFLFFGLLQVGGPFCPPQARAFSLILPVFFGSIDSGAKLGNNLALAYTELNLAILTGGVELGYQWGDTRLDGRRLDYGYPFATLYGGLHFPWDNKDVYLNGGWSRMLGDSFSRPGYEYDRKWAWFLDGGYRLALCDDSLVLGIGLRHTRLKIADRAGEGHGSRENTIYLNIGYNFK